MEPGIGGNNPIWRLVHTNHGPCPSVSPSAIHGSAPGRNGQNLFESHWLNQWLTQEANRGSHCTPNLASLCPPTSYSEGAWSDSIKPAFPLRHRENARHSDLDARWSLGQNVL
jgi:hypothetical protein